MSLMMAFMTHQDHGANASSTFLRGVTRGSYSYLVAMLVLAETLRWGNLLLAFALAMGAALAVQAGVQAFDSLPRLKRAVTSELDAEAASSFGFGVPERVCP